MNSRFIQNTIFLAMIAACGVVPSLRATNYYYVGTGSVTATANWKTNTDGSGSSPANFTAAGNIFFIQSGQTASATAAWTVSGIGSGVTILTGGSMLGGANNHSITLSMQSGASYTTSSTYTNLSFGTVDAASTFNVNSANFRPTVGTYGNLNYAPTTPATLSPGSNVSVAGNFLLKNTGFNTRIATSSNLSWTVSKDLTLQSTLDLTSGTGNATLNIGGGLDNSAGGLAKSGGGTGAINFNGTGSSNVTWGVHSGSFTTTIANGKTIKFLDNLNTTNGSLTVSGTLDTNGTRSITVGTGSFSTDSTGVLRVGGDGVVGSLTTDKLSLGGSLKLDINSAISSDLLTATSLTYGGALSINFTGQYAGNFNLIDFTGIPTGNFSTISITGSYTASLARSGNLWTGVGTGGVGTFTFDQTTGILATVPEPNQYAVAIAGMLVALIVVRRRNSLKV